MVLCGRIMGVSRRADGQRRLINWQRQQCRLSLPGFGESIAQGRGERECWRQMLGGDEQRQRLSFASASALICLLCNWCWQECSSEAAGVLQW